MASSAVAVAQLVPSVIVASVGAASRADDSEIQRPGIYETVTRPGRA